MALDQWRSANLNRYSGGRAAGLKHAYRYGLNTVNNVFMNTIVSPSPTNPFINTIENVASPIILAGGLTPENINNAVKITSPYGVDVSGGVETAPGQKDSQKVVNFIQQAKKMAE